MGDRANVRILQHRGVAAEQSEEYIHLYTHWTGTGLARTLQQALARKLRWSDEAYLARIIFCEMVKGREEAETGYGIAMDPPDNSHQFLTVDCAKQLVWIGDTKYFTFKAFIDLSPEELDAEYLGEGEEE